jgi:hypothetical protein
MPIERRVNIVKALRYVYLKGEKMANNFVTKNVKKLKFQENFFPPGGCKREKKLLRFQRSKNFSEMLFSFYKA